MLWEGGRDGGELKDTLGFDSTRGDFLFNS